MSSKTIVFRRRRDLDAMYNVPSHQVGQISTMNESRSDLQRYSLPITGQRTKVVERTFYLDPGRQDYEPTRLNKGILYKAKSNQGSSIGAQMKQGLRRIRR